MIQTNISTELEPLVRNYITNHDRAFEQGDLDECYRIESEYDAAIRGLGFDPVELHDYLCSMGQEESLSNCLNNYLRNLAALCGGIENG